MGKGDRRKSASSAQAAEILAKTKGGHASSSMQSHMGLAGGFSFGSRYISQVADDEQANSTEHTVQAHGVASISPTWSRYFQHLSKADARTRQKALLSLREAVRSSPEEAGAFLDLWSQQFPRLVMDQSKQVRIAACQVMADVADAVGRQMASIIRSVFPFLFFCKFDPSQEVSQEAQKALSGMFPGDKYFGALDFCSKSVFKEITVIMQASPEVLGDPKKETSEEMEERYHRMLSQSLRGMNYLVKTADGATRDGHSSTFLQGVNSVLCTLGFRRSCLESNNSAVRRDAYDMITVYCLSKSRAKDLEGLMHVSVFHCLKDAEPANVVSLFAMIIAYGRSFESSWNCIDFETDFADEIFRILGCCSYSSHIFDVYKSILPLISVVPPSLLTDAFVSSMIEALWNTHGALGHNPKVCCAARQALVECILLSYARMGAALQAESDTEKFLLEIFSKSLDASDVASMHCAHSLFKELLASLARCKHVSQSILISETDKILSDRLQSDFGSPSIFRFIQSLDDNLIALQISVLVGAFSGRDAAFWESVDLSIMHQLQANIQSACTKVNLNLEQLLDSDSSFNIPGPRVLSLYRTEFYPQLLSRLLASQQSCEELPALGCLSFTLLQGSTLNRILVPEAFETLLKNFRFDIAAAMNETLLGLQMPKNMLLSLQSDALDSIGDDFMSLVKSDIDYSCDKWNFKKTFVLGKNGQSLLSTKKAANIFKDLVDCAVLMSEMSAKLFILGMADEVYRSHVDINRSICYATLETYLAMLLGCLWEEILETVDAQQELDQIKCDLENNSAIVLINEILTSPMFDDYLAFVSSQDVCSLDGLLGHTLQDMEIFLDKNLKEDGTYHWEVKFMLSYTLEAFHHIRSSFLALAIESLIPIFTRLPHLFLETIEIFGDTFLNDTLSDSKGLIFVSSILAKLVGQGINSRPIFASLEHNTSYIPLILRETWRIMVEKTGTVSAGDFSKLLYTCLSSESKGVKNCSADFLCQLVDSSNVDLFCDEGITVVGNVSTLLRSNEELFKVSNLGRFAYTTAEVVLRGGNVSEINNFIASCYPVHENAANRRYWSPFQPGSQVWWFDAKSRTWNPGIVLSMDSCLSPPSYTVKTDEGVRDTEPERLSLRQSGPFQVPHPGDSVHLGQSIWNYAIHDKELVKLQAIWSLLIDQFGDRNCEKITLQERGRTLSSIASISSIVWGDLGREAKVAAIQQCSEALKVACANLEECVTATLLTSLNKIFENVVGQELEDLASMCDFFDKLQPNQAIQRSEKVMGLYKQVRSALCSDLAKYCEANSDAVVGALECFFVLSDLESMSRLTGVILEWEKSELSMLTCVFKIFSLLGEVVRLVSLTASHEEEDCKCLQQDMWHHVAKVVYFALKKADSKFLDMCATEYNKSSKLMSMSSSFVYLAFSSHQSIMSLVAVSGILLMPNFLNELWKPNSETFFRDIEVNISSGLKSSLISTETAQELEACGMNRQVAEMLCIPHNPNYHLAWFLLIVYLNSREVDNSSRDLLLMVLKEKGSIVQSMLDGLCRAVQARRLADGRFNSVQVIRSYKMLESEHIDANLIDVFLTLNDLDRLDSELSGTYIPEESIFLGAFVGLQVASRAWFLELTDRRIQGFAVDYVKTYVNSVVVSREFNELKQNIDSQDAAWSKSFEIYPETHRDRIIARLEVEDGHCLELTLSFPPEYPLKAPIVKLEKYVGITEAKARKWLLSITAFLMNRNGTITEVINLWRNNVAKEFEGQEDCLICYSIIQPSTGQLPKLNCKTCHQKFHGTCLYKWFRSSSKSNCPHCQSPW